MPLDTQRDCPRSRRHTGPAAVYTLDTLDTFDTFTPSYPSLHSPSMSALSISSASSAGESSISLGMYPMSPCADGASPPRTPTLNITPAVTQISGDSGQHVQQRARHMLPAAMVPLGQRRDSSSGGRPPQNSPAPQVDEYVAHSEGVRHKPAPMGVRARDHLVGILLRHSAGRALILPPESLPGWSNWILSILHSLGIPITSYGSEWEEEERPEGLQPSEPRDNQDDRDDHIPPPAASSSADLVVIRKRYPLVRRTQSAPGPYSDRYPAANSFRVLRHQFSPRPQRRRLGESAFPISTNTQAPTRPPTPAILTALSSPPDQVTRPSSSAQIRRSGPSRAPSPTSCSEAVSPGSRRDCPSAASWASPIPNWLCSTHPGARSSA